MASAVPPDARETLNSWKDIAAYLGKSVRSVQRWERELGLPIRRIHTPDGGQIVFANRLEIDGWKHAQDVARTPPDRIEQAADASAARRARWKTWLTERAAFLVLGLAIGATSVALIRFSISGRPERFEIDDNTLTAYTRAGTPVWRYSFGRTAQYAPNGRLSTTEGDVDGDGSIDVVVAVRFSPPMTKSPYSDAMFAFRRDGSLIWQIQPVLRMSHKGETFDGPWQVMDFRVSADRGRPRVWIAYNHHTWRPGFVLEVEPTGKSLLRYVQSGWLHGVAYWSRPTGALLAVGGVAHEHSRASVALLNIDSAPAQSVPNGDSLIVCDGCPRGEPDAFFLFPVSELATTVYFRPYSWARQLSQDGIHLKVTTDEGFGAGSVASISPDFRVVEFERADQYWQAHRVFEQQNRIAHTAEACPERTGMHEIRRWTPDAGWTATKIASQIPLPLQGR